MTVTNRFIPVNEWNDFLIFPRDFGHEVKLPAQTVSGSYTR